MKVKTIVKYAHTHSQLATTESLTANMTQQVQEMRAIGNATEVRKKGLLTHTYIAIYLNKPPMMINSTSTDATFGGT